MGSEDGDPHAIWSVAVTAEDVVTAYEARQRSPRRPVLRVTPPFSGRMRARLHDPGSADSDSSALDSRSETAVHPETGALHVPPERFVAEDEIPPYPTPDETEDALRADPDVAFSKETHRERHVEAVEAWRKAVVDAVVERAELRLPDGGHRIEVKTLGDSSSG